MKRIKLSRHEPNPPENSPSSGPFRESNPLRIDLVLETLFPFCSVNTLKNCRLVSKQWKDISLKAWRNKAILCPGKNTEGLSNLQSYVKMLQCKPKKKDDLQLKEYPFKNFKIQSSLTEYLKEKTVKPVSDIARHVVLFEYKVHIKELEDFLSKSTSSEVLELRNCDWNWELDQDPPYSSNVKSLRLVKNNDDKSFGFGCFDWKRLLKCFEKLEAFSVEFRKNKMSLSGTGNILSSLREITKSAEDRGQTVMPLKELEVIHLFQEQEKSYGHENYLKNVNTDIVRSIKSYQFQLERLTIHVVWDKDTLERQIRPIFDILKSCKETLCYLSTSFNFVVSDEVFNLHFKRKREKPYTMYMEKLKEVNLSNGLWGMNILAGLELPNLEKLVIDSKNCIEKMNDYKEFQLPFPESRVYEKLTTLEFLDNRKIPGRKTIKAFAKIIPNLVHLTMPFDKFTFAVVCESFKGLKTLNALAAQCRYEELDDDSFTGISRGAAPGAPRKPNITDLGLLTDLSIPCGTEMQGNAPFTDHSVIYGLLHLPRLHSLSIGFKELSDESKEKLMVHVKGYVDIKVGTSIPGSYFDIEVDFED